MRFFTSSPTICRVHFYSRFAAELCLVHLVCAVEFTATWFADEFHFAPRTTHNVGPNMKSTWLATNFRISKSSRDWQSSLVRISLTLPDLTARTERNDRTTCTDCTHCIHPPSLPRWRLGGFPLPRNSLGKGFQKLDGRTSTLVESATSLSQGVMWFIPKTHRNLGQGWLIGLEVRCRPSACIHRGKYTTFQDPPLNHPCHKLRPLLAWTNNFCQSIHCFQMKI